MKPQYVMLERTCSNRYIFMLVTRVKPSITRDLEVYNGRVILTNTNALASVGDNLVVIHKASWNSTFYESEEAALFDHFERFI